MELRQDVIDHFGQEFCPDQELRISALKSRPFPSLKGWLALQFVWLTRFTRSESQPVKIWHLRFLKRHLSEPLFADLTMSIRSERYAIYGKNEPVDYWKIITVLHRKRHLARLQRMVALEKQNDEVLNSQIAILSE